MLSSVKFLLLAFVLSNWEFHCHGHVNPCSSYWSYVRELGNYQGRVTIKNPSVTDKLKVKLVLSITGYLPTEYEGAFELLTDENTAKQNVLSRGDIVYRVIFPIQQPLPVILDLQVNDVSLCRGEKAHGAIATSIKYFHVLNLQGFGSNPNFQTTNRPNYYTTPPQNYYRPEPSRAPPNNAAIHFQSDNSFSDCGQIEDRAVGLVVQGQSFKKSEWPWLTALFYRNQFICGGTLVSQNHVITAAHCVNDKRDYRKKLSDLFFVIGAHNLNSPDQDSQTRRISTFISHPDWNPNSEKFDADLAIAVLSSAVQFTRFIKPACLPPPEGIVLVNKVGTLAGWGRTENYDISLDDPRKLKIPVVTITDCLNSNQDFRRIVSPRTFCAGSRDGRGPCSGDSGGGFLIAVNGKWSLVGLISASLRGTTLECNPDEYAVFTNLLKFDSWIRNYIE